MSGASLSELVLIQLGLAARRLADLSPSDLCSVVLHHEDDGRDVTAIGAIRAVERELRQVRYKLITQGGREVA